MSRKLEQGQVTILVAPSIKTETVLDAARQAARDAGGYISGPPDRIDHGIVLLEGQDVDLRERGLHAITFTMERV